MLITKTPNLLKNGFQVFFMKLFKIRVTVAINFIFTSAEVFYWVQEALTLALLLSNFALVNPDDGPRSSQLGWAGADSRGNNTAPLVSAPSGLFIATLNELFFIAAKTLHLNIYTHF